MNELQQALSRQLAHSVENDPTITNLRRLTGGASRETWSFTLASRHDEGRDLILRRDPGNEEDPVRMSREAAAIREARLCDIPVPDILDTHDHSPESEIGGSFLIMSKLPGEALPQRLLRDPEYDLIRPRLAYEMGLTLGRIHLMRPNALPDLPVGDPLDDIYSSYLDTGSPLPTLEIAFHWLRANRPSGSRTAVVHGDFRTGNLLIDATGITGVLDWELVHLGDPMEDLGWVCTRTWRFGSSEPVGGFGSREDLFNGYREASGFDPDPRAVHWWEVFGSLRWAVMCRLQAARANSTGAGDSLELLTIGRQVVECEHDLLDHLGLERNPQHGSDINLQKADSPGDLFGEPHIGTLLRSVTAFVLELSEGADPRTRYRGKIAAKVLSMAERESVLGYDFRAEHQSVMETLGFSTERELALAIRDGVVGVKSAPIAQAVRGAVDARLVVANPRY